MLERPIRAFVAVSLASGFLYLAMMWTVVRREVSRGLLLAGLVGGLAIRAGFLFSTPVLEDDFYRYLWDGGVAAQGINPYRYAPGQVDSEPAGSGMSHADEGAIHDLQALASRSDGVFERVNHPALRTIYPPVAQGFFALAWVAKPWSLTSWRVVLLGVDVLTLVLLSGLLARLNLPRVFLLIYWLNPLLLRETYLTAHMDILLFPFLLGSFWCTSKGNRVGGSGLLALAAGVKIWPALFLPLILWPRVGKESVQVGSGPKTLLPPGNARMRWQRSRLLSFSVFVAACSVLALPVLWARVDDASGFVRYARVWEMNDAFYMVVLWGGRLAGRWIEMFAHHDHMAARGIVLAVVCAVALWQTFKVRRLDHGLPGNGHEIYHRGLVIVATLFFLSPTQFPWYGLWLLPFLAIRPAAPLLLLTVLLSLYYLRFYFQAIDRVGVFDNGVVWAEYLPVVGWMIIERWSRKRKPSPSGPLLTRQEVGQ